MVDQSQLIQNDRAYDDLIEVIKTNKECRYVQTCASWVLEKVFDRRLPISTWTKIKDLNTCHLQRSQVEDLLRCIAVDDSDSHDTIEFFRFVFYGGQ